MCVCVCVFVCVCKGLKGFSACVVTYSSDAGTGQAQNSLWRDAPILPDDGATALQDGSLRTSWRNLKEEKDKKEKRFSS